MAMNAFRASVLFFPGEKMAQFISFPAALFTSALPPPPPPPPLPYCYVPQ
jgi:hypothetical protein